MDAETDTQKLESSSLVYRVVSRSTWCPAEAVCFVGLLLPIMQGKAA